MSFALFGSPRDVELDEHGVPVARDLAAAVLLEHRVLDVRDVRLERERLRRPPAIVETKAGLARVVAAALDEHVLGRRLRQAGPLEHPQRRRRLAGRVLGVLHLDVPDDAPDDHRRDGEDEPAEERPLPVLCAPAAGAAGEIQRAHGLLLSSVVGSWVDGPPGHAGHR